MKQAPRLVRQMARSGSVFCPQPYGKSDVPLVAREAATRPARARLRTKLYVERDFCNSRVRAQRAAGVAGSNGCRVEYGPPSRISWRPRRDTQWMTVAAIRVAGT